MTDPKGIVKVHFSELLQAATDIKAASTAINQHLDDLKTNVIGPLAGTWTGAASDFYQDAQRRWTDAINSLNATLARTGVLVQQAAERYEETEGINKSLWRV